MSEEDRRILVVEDELPVLNSIEEALEDEFEIVKAESRDVALSLIRNTSRPFQVIVTDQHLGDGYGNAVLSEILFLNPYTVRVIFSGADDASAAAIAVNEARVDRYIDKGSMTAFSELREVCLWGVFEYKRRMANQAASDGALVNWYKTIAYERFSALKMYLPDRNHERIWQAWKPSLSSPPPYSALSLWKDAKSEMAFQTYLKEGFKVLIDSPTLSERYRGLLEDKEPTGNPLAGDGYVVSPFALINMDRKAWRRSLVAFELSSRELRGVRFRGTAHG